MGWPAPAYAHHRLLTDEAGRRLAKRDRLPLTFRAAGTSLSGQAVGSVRE